MDDDGVRLRAHPPERKRRSTALHAAGCCSCCCCCCVHSVGGLAGAVYGGSVPKPPDPESPATPATIREAEDVRTARQYAARVYWMALAVCALITVAVFTLIEPRDRWAGLEIIGVFLPLGQLAASILSAVFICCRPPRRLEVCLRRLGRITLFAFIGALAGTAGTVISFYML